MVAQRAIDTSGRDPAKGVIRAIRVLWLRKIVESVDQDAVVDKLDDEASLTGRYVFMTAMSAGIAVLGLLLSSPAVVIGAMLLSPLMSPIIGSGFALATGNFGWLRECAKSLVIGGLLAILLCALIVLLSPLQTVTPEIAARTRPNLFDLGVAFFSALAGSYAVIRGREGTIVGVAIATALMPPLAVIGFGLATGNVTVFLGSLMLFFTNLVTISLTAAIMARLYGFRSNLSARQSIWQGIGIATAFIVLAIPLGASLRQIAWETNASRQINGFIKDQFSKSARISQLDIDYDVRPIRIAATVLTPAFSPQAETQSRKVLERTLRQPVDISIDQFRVGANPRAAEAAQIAAAKAQEEAAATERQIAKIGELLSLAGGVSPDDVLIDREHQRAVVRARSIEGTSLAGYWQLERRVAALSPNWTIELVPPVRPLPDVQFSKDNQPTDEGLVQLALISWAANRLNLPVALSGSAEQSKYVADFLTAKGIAVQQTKSGSPRDTVVVKWGVTGVAGSQHAPAGG